MQSPFQDYHSKVSTPAFLGLILYFLQVIFFDKLQAQGAAVESYIFNKLHAQGAAVESNANLE